MGPAGHTHLQFPASASGGPEGALQAYRAPGDRNQTEDRQARVSPIQKTVLRQSFDLPTVSPRSQELPDGVPGFSSNQGARCLFLEDSAATSPCSLGQASAESSSSVWGLGGGEYTFV